MEAIQQLKQALQEASAVVIGAGSGLSTAAGLTYSGGRFQRYFSDFIGKYGIRDMYFGGFFPFANKNEYWAWWSRVIYLNRYVLHTVGPIVRGVLTEQAQEQLASCYRSCLDLAAAKGCRSLAFCCISTGVFGFPKKEAAHIAITTVSQWLRQHEPIEVVLNVFTEEDRIIYERELVEKGE